MIRARPTFVQLTLATALDHWAALHLSLHRQAGTPRLLEVARLADPDPWRNRLRELLQTSASQDRLGRLKELASSGPLEELPAVSLQLLGETLLHSGDPVAAATVLGVGQRLYPGDFWLSFTIAECMDRLGRSEEAIRYYMAARSLRPEAAHALAHALEERGETDEAIRVLQDLGRLRPNETLYLTCLGDMLQRRGRTADANALFEKTIAVAHAALRAKRNVAETHNLLGMALARLGKTDAAITEYGEAFQINPKLPQAHMNLGEALKNQGKLNEAIAEYRDAIRLNSDDYRPHGSLGTALRLQGKLDEAIAEDREALRLKPDSHHAHTDLGVALIHQGKLLEAITEFREALRLKPDSHIAHDSLGACSRVRGS